jgi:hypothetical protein
VACCRTCPGRWSAAAAAAGYSCYVAVQEGSCYRHQRGLQAWHERAAGGGQPHLSASHLQLSGRSRKACMWRQQQQQMCIASTTCTRLADAARRAQGVKCMLLMCPPHLPSARWMPPAPLGSPTACPSVTSCQALLGSLICPPPLPQTAALLLATAAWGPAASCRHTPPVGPATQTHAAGPTWPLLLRSRRPPPAAALLQGYRADSTRRMAEGCRELVTSTAPHPSGEGQLHPYPP